jgi:hypothetical protein
MMITEQNNTAHGNKALRYSGDTKWNKRIPFTSANRLGAADNVAGEVTGAGVSLTAINPFGLSCSFLPCRFCQA